MEVRRAAHTPRDARIIERFLGAEQEAFTSSSTDDFFCRVSRLEPTDLADSFDPSFSLSLSGSSSLGVQESRRMSKRAGRQLGTLVRRNEDFCHFSALMSRERVRISMM